MKASLTAPDPSPAERRLIAACMAGGVQTVAGAVNHGISAETFADPMLGIIWQALVQTATEDKDTHVFKVGRRAFGSAIDAESMGQLAEIAALEPTSIFAKQLTIEVIDANKRRKAVTKLAQALGAVTPREGGEWEEDWSAARKAIYEAELAVSIQGATKSLSAIVDEYIHDEMHGKEAGVVGTGLPHCDEYFGKIRGGEVCVIAGRPGVGKTALAIQMADSVVRGGGKAMIVSLEMQARDLVGRLAKQRLGRSAGIVRGCTAAEYQSAKTSWIASAQKMKADEKRLHIFEVRQVKSVSDIEDRVAMLKAADALPNVVVIDYLQLLHAEDSRAPREQQVALMSRRIKLMALNFNVAVILLSQLNRDAEKDGSRPKLSGLRESGAIEQDADRVWLLYPDPDVMAVPDAPTVQVVIDQAKNRNGAGGIAKVVEFFKPSFSFHKKL